MLAKRIQEDPCTLIQIQFTSSHITNSKIKFNRHCHKIVSFIVYFQPNIGLLVTCIFTLDIYLVLSIELFTRYQQFIVNVLTFFHS